MNRLRLIRAVRTLVEQDDPLVLLTLRQIAALSLIADGDGEIRPRDITNRLRISPGAVSRNIIDPLEAAGMITRTEVIDQRTFALRLTKWGWAIINGGDL